MSTFILAISCLTTSNLPWFMDLTFQVPVQYCSLQHQTLLPLPVTSTTGCCFCFGSVSSFFLELFLHWSPVVYWALPTWGVHLSVSYLFAFSFCAWGSQGKNSEVVCPFSSGPCFIRTLHHDPSILVACCRVGGTECSSTCMRPLKEVAIIFLTSTIVWPQVK